MWDPARQTRIIDLLDRMGVPFNRTQEGQRDLRLFGGSLSSVSVGDIVAGGLIADSGLTLDQVSALPLRVLLDLPAASGCGGSSGLPIAAAKSRALKRALALLGPAPKPAAHKRGRAHRHKHNKSRTRRHARRA